MKAILFLLLTVLPVTTLAQQKRQTPPRPQPKAAPAPAPEPSPTFDTLLPANSYTIYAEVRSAGQLVRSNDVNELLEPVLKLAGPPKEFKSAVKWLKAHADELMTSRLLVAVWPMKKDLPQTLVAIEFASAEEAAKFVTSLNEFLPTVLPPVPEASPAAVIDTRKPAPPPIPGFHLQRLGSLVLIASKQWTMKQLKPAGSKLLSEDANFRTARNRFNSEPVFVYIDVKTREREEAERRKGYEAAQREEEERAKRELAAAAEQQKQTADPEKPEEAGNEVVISTEQRDLVAAVGSEPAKEAPTPDPMSAAVTNLGMAFFIGEADWPDAVAVALVFEGDSIDLRALLVNAPGEKSDALPLFPKFIPAAAIAPESPNIFPADTEVFVAMSLDLPQLYATMSKPVTMPQFISKRAGNEPPKEPESPIAAIEKQLKINIKDDLLPLLGSEIAIALPMQGMGIVGIPGVMTSVTNEKESSGKAPVVAIEVRDKERLRPLLPKILDSFGLKGVSALAQTERREDTELVSFANVFAYAFIGDFIVLSGDAASIRKIVDSYLKHETLAADTQFKNYTRWQPRQLHGQIYISPSLMESLKAWTTQPNSGLSEQTRAYLVPASMLSQPVTYSLSNEGNGPLHELHLPKNLVLMAVAGISGEVNPPATVQKERMALGLMYSIAGAQQRYKESKGAGSYGTLEQLIAENLVSKEMIENSGYRFELTFSGDNFEVSAAPLEYGKTGKMSYFMDNTRMIRGADRGGAPATASDPPIQ